MLFTKDQTDALYSAVKKWEGILRGNIDNGVQDCECCKRWISVGCKGCPIFQYSKNVLCNNTPYYGWVLHHDDMHPERAYACLCGDCLTLAKKELAFLKNLHRLTILLRRF